MSHRNEQRTILTKRIASKFAERDRVGKDQSKARDHVARIRKAIEKEIAYLQRDLEQVS